MGTPPGRKQPGPFVDDCAAGKYAWCRCAHSATYPYCDGAHRGSGITPLKVVFERSCRVAWCACGGTGTPPFCDGSHRRSPA
ncbi:MAG: CDGSH iron-sulfur domain-containing protein [Planctomycetes bacterium]|nr:CDGSH iron-sulfur domain-containing protein [Planctomycetota bacterium]